MANNPEFDLGKLTLGDMSDLQEAGVRSVENRAWLHLVIPIAAKCAGLTEKDVREMLLKKGGDFLNQFTEKVLDYLSDLATVEAAERLLRGGKNGG